MTNRWYELGASENAAEAIRQCLPRGVELSDAELADVLAQHWGAVSPEERDALLAGYRGDPSNMPALAKAFDEYADRADQLERERDELRSELEARRLIDGWMRDGMGADHRVLRITESGKLLALVNEYYPDGRYRCMSMSATGHDYPSLAAALGLTEVTK